MTTSAFERAVGSLRLYHRVRTEDNGAFYFDGEAPQMVRAVLRAIKYVDGTDEDDLIDVSTKLRMEAVSAIEAYDGMLDHLLSEG